MKILGLDIGTFSIKAVEFDANFGKVELNDYIIEEVVEPVGDSTIVSEPTEPAPKTGKGPALPPKQLISKGQLLALRRILGDGVNPGRLRSKKQDRICISLPKTAVTTRLLQFPTKDRKAIQNSLTFELDDELPFDLEDAVYDFALLNTTGNVSSVFTALTLKHDITEFISQLQMYAFDPDTITVDPWAEGQLLKRCLLQELEGHPVCVVNIGHTFTTVNVYLNDSPIFAHTAQYGGRHLTASIASALNVSFDEAEKIKIDHGFLVTKTHRQGSNAEKISQDQEDFSNLIAQGLTPIIREIKQTLMAYKSRFKMPPRAILLTGGSSQIPNLPLFLEELFEVRTYLMTYMSSVVGSTLQLSETTESQITTATGLAMAAVKPDRHFNINFRTNEFSKKGGAGPIDFNSLRRPLRYVAASLAFVYANLMVQGLILSSRFTSQEDRLERSVKSVLGPVSPTVMSTYLRSPSTLKNAVSKEISKYRIAPASPPKPIVSAFEVLNRVSAKIPRDMILDVTNFTVKEGTFRLAGLVDQPTNPDRILRALEETKLLTEVTKGKVQEDPKSDPKLRKMQFEISARVAEGSNVKSK